MTHAIVCPICARTIVVTERKDAESFTGREYADHVKAEHPESWSPVGVPYAPVVEVTEPAPVVARCGSAEPHGAHATPAAPIGPSGRWCAGNLNVVLAEPEPVAGDILVRLPRAGLVTLLQALEEVRQTGPARLASAAFAAIQAIDEAEAYVEQTERETAYLAASGYALANDPVLLDSLAGQDDGEPEPERSNAQMVRDMEAGISSLADFDGCPACGRDIDADGGNPDCETCAAEPSEMDRLLGDLAGILSEQDSGGSWSQPETLELVDAISLAISEAVVKHDAARRSSPVLQG